MELKQFIKEVKASMNAKRSSSILDLKPLLEMYNERDWMDYIDIEINIPKEITLFQDEQMELFLTYWPGFQKNRKNEYLREGSLIKVLSGNLIETRFNTLDPNKIIKKRTHSEGAIIYVNEHVTFHAVEYPVPYSAFSLNIYLPRINNSKIDNLEENELAFRM